MVAEQHPDTRRFAEGLVWAARVLRQNLPAGDPVRSALTLGADIPDSGWMMLHVTLDDGSVVVTHPENGPTMKLPGLGRWYRACPVPVEHALVGQLDPNGEEATDVASAYVDGRSVASLIDPRPDVG